MIFDNAAEGHSEMDRGVQVYAPEFTEYHR